MKPRPLHRINETYESGALKLLLSRKDKSVSDEECEKTDQTSRDISSLYERRNARESLSSVEGNRRRGNSNDLHHNHRMELFIWE